MTLAITVDTFSKESPMATTPLSFKVKGSKRIKSGCSATNSVVIFSFRKSCRGQIIPKGRDSNMFAKCILY